MARANSAFNGSGAAQAARCVINTDKNRWLAPMRLTRKNRWLAPMRLITNYEVVSIPLKPSLFAQLNLTAKLCGWEIYPPESMLMALKYPKYSLRAASPGKKT
jgi:hypothetical protein